MTVLVPHVVHEECGEQVPVEIEATVLAAMAALVERLLDLRATDTGLAQSQLGFDLVVSATGAYDRALDPCQLSTRSSTLYRLGPEAALPGFHPVILGSDVPRDRDQCVRHRSVVGVSPGSHDSIQVDNLGLGLFGELGTVLPMAVALDVSSLFIEALW